MLKQMSISTSLSKSKLRNNKSLTKPQNKNKPNTKSQSSLPNHSIIIKPPIKKQNSLKNAKQNQHSSSFLNDSSCTKASTKIGYNNDQNDLPIFNKSPSYGKMRSNSLKLKKPKNHSINKESTHNSSKIIVRRSNSMIIRDNSLHNNNVSNLSNQRNFSSNSICSSQPNYEGESTSTYKSFCKLFM